MCVVIALELYKQRELYQEEEKVRIRFLQSVLEEDFDRAKGLPMSWASIYLPLYFASSLILEKHLREKNTNLQILILIILTFLNTLHI